MKKTMVIGIVNRRGGVGKTITAQTLGAGLHLKGYKVLLIDLDSQSNLSFDTGAKPSSLTSLEVLTGTATMEEAIQHTGQADIVPASPALSTADTVLDGTGKEYRLREALEGIEGQYDFIIIDTPPALNVLTINALTASDEVIIPSQAEVHSLQGIALLYQEAITAVKKYTNPDLHILGILLTRYNGRAILSKEMKSQLEATAKELGTKLFETPIRECISLKEAQALQRDVITYAPRSNATADYKALIEEVEKRGTRR